MELNMIVMRKVYVGLVYMNMNPKPLNTLIACEGVFTMCLHDHGIFAEICRSILR